jgi:hypothetical protein
MTHSEHHARPFAEMMFRATRLCALALLALTLLTAPALAQTEEEVTDAPAGAPDVSDLPALPILEIPLYVDRTRADFALYEGDNLNDAAEKFGVTHDLAPEALATLKGEVARRLLSITEAINANRAQSADAKQLLFEVPMELESGEVVNLRLYEGDVLLEAVKKFAEQQSIPEDFVPHLFEEVKKKITKNGADGAQFGDGAVVFDFPVTFDGETEHRVVLRKGDVVHEVIDKMAAELELEEDVKAQFLAGVLERVRAAAVAADEAEAESRAAAGKAPLYEIAVKRGEDTLPLRLYEGDVLEQAVSAFVARHGFSEDAVPLLMEGAIASMEKAREGEPLRDEQGRLAIISLAVSLDVEEEGAAEGEEADADAAPKKKKQLPPIVLFEGQTPEEAATAYCEANGLDPEVVGPQLADVLRQGAAKREAAIAEAAAAEAAEQEASREPEGEEEASETAEEASA